MQVVCDFHLHSKYSRAVSPQMTLPVMTEYAKEKGIDILTASDFTHPLWFKEIQTQLEETSEGMYSVKQSVNSTQQSDKKEPRFILSTEISSIYSENGKLRRIHNLVFAPNIETVEKINTVMKNRGYNLHSDGRPIIGLPSRNLLEMILEIDERCLLVPCHVWTPHFGLYGSQSGYDGIEEAFGELSKYIYGIETGISSDPEMNWQIPELENRSILSFSDAHSPAKMGREATVFVPKDGIPNSKIQISNVTYDDIRLAIMRDPKGKLKIGYTVEFYPEEGKYHFSGHRNCKVVKTPEEIEKQGIACPTCGKRLTEGVFIRLQQLSGKKMFGTSIRKENEYGLVWLIDPKENQPPYVKLVPLLEIVAESLGSTVQSQKSKNLYSLLIKTFGTEFDVLLKTPIHDIAVHVNDNVAEGISKVRGGNIVIRPGYDGEYGVVRIWSEGEEHGKRTPSPQLSLDL